MKKSLLKNVDLFALFIIIICFAILDVFNQVLPFRILLGIIIVTYIPGYSLISAISNTKQISFIEISCISVVLSIPVVLFIGMLLNITVGINSTSVLFCIFLFYCINSLIAIYRRISFSEKRPQIEFPKIHPINVQEWDKYFWGILLIGAIIVGILFVVILIRPNNNEKYTEISIQNSGFLEQESPLKLKLNDPINFTLDIKNNEHEQTRYKLVIMMDTLLVYSDSFNLQQGQVAQKTIDFPANKVGTNEEIQILLYKNDIGEVYRSLHFWINVGK